jgi:hypothetical protein
LFKTVQNEQIRFRSKGQTNSAALAIFLAFGGDLKNLKEKDDDEENVGDRDDSDGDSEDDFLGELGDDVVVVEQKKERGANK